MISLDDLKKSAKNTEAENKAFFRKIKPGKSNQLDKAFHAENKKVFNKLNCLDCAYCCNSLGPRLTDKDIREMSKELDMKASEFENKYLKTDEDNDLVFSQLPCPFLDKDNYCLVYNSRPRACRDYPHTHQPEILRKKEIHIKNTFVCPAVFEIFENVKKSWK